LQAKKPSIGHSDYIRIFSLQNDAIVTQRVEIISYYDQSVLIIKHGELDSQYTLILQSIY